MLLFIIKDLEVHYARMERHLSLPNIISWQTMPGCQTKPFKFSSVDRDDWYVHFLPDLLRPVHTALLEGASIVPSGLSCFFSSSRSCYGSPLVKQQIMTSHCP